MITIPKEFRKQISSFAPLFTRKVFKHVKILLMGSILVVGRRTVCSALRAMGLEQKKRFHKYHRVLSQAKWSVFQAGRILLELLINNFVSDSESLVFGIDERATMGPPRGRKINARGVYRDAVGSSHSYFVKCSDRRPVVYAGWV